MILAPLYYAKPAATAAAPTPPTLTTPPDAMVAAVRATIPTVSAAVCKLLYVLLLILNVPLTEPLKKGKTPRCLHRGSLLSLFHCGFHTRR